MGLGENIEALYLLVWNYKLVSQCEFQNITLCGYLYSFRIIPINAAPRFHWLLHSSWSLRIWTCDATRPLLLSTVSWVGSGLETGTVVVVVDHPQ